MPTGIFGKGIPTQPDVEALKKRWPAEQMKPGDIITFDDVATVIGVDKDANRWKSVTTAWRNQLKPLYLHCPGDKTFLVLNDSGVFRKGHKEFRSCGRMGRKSAITISHVNQKNLTTEEKDKCLKLQQQQAAFLSVLQIRASSSGTAPTLLGDG